MPADPTPSAINAVTLSDRGKQNAEVLTWMGTAYARPSGSGIKSASRATQATTSVPVTKDGQIPVDAPIGVSLDRSYGLVAAAACSVALITFAGFLTFDKSTPETIVSRASDADVVAKPITAPPEQTIVPESVPPSNVKTAESGEPGEATPAAEVAPTAARGPAPPEQMPAASLPPAEVKSGLAAEETAPQPAIVPVQSNEVRAVTEAEQSTRNAQLASDRAAREATDRQVAAEKVQPAHQAAVEVSHVNSEPPVLASVEPPAKVDHANMDDGNSSTSVEVTMVPPTIRPVTPPVSLPATPPVSPAVAPKDAPVRNAGSAKPGTAELAAGRKRLASGDLEGARKFFASAASKGLAEAALAFGTTYDPVSLAKLGLKDDGDPSRARQWYRKAYVMVMRPN